MKSGEACCSCGKPHPKLDGMSVDQLVHGFAIRNLNMVWMLRIGVLAVFSTGAVVGDSCRKILLPLLLMSLGAFVGRVVLLRMLQHVL